MTNFTTEHPNSMMTEGMRQVLRVLFLWGIAWTSRTFMPLPESIQQLGGYLDLVLLTVMASAGAWARHNGLPVLRWL